MTIGLWLMVLLGVLLVGAGGWLLAHGFFSDWLLSRGVRRRCRQCRFDMRQTVGLRCGECGRVATSERELTRARIRWRWIWAGTAVCGLGLGHVAWGMGSGTAWVSLIPRNTPVAYWAWILEVSPTTGVQVQDALYRYVADIQPGDHEFAQIVREGNRRALHRVSRQPATSVPMQRLLASNIVLLLNEGLGTGEDILMMATGTELLRNELKRHMRYTKKSVSWSEEDRARVIDLLNRPDEEAAPTLGVVCSSVLVQDDIVLRQRGVEAALRSLEPAALGQVIQSGLLTQAQLCELLAADAEGLPYLVDIGEYSFPEDRMYAALSSINDQSVSHAGSRLVAELLLNAGDRASEEAARVLDRVDVSACLDEIVAATHSSNPRVRQRATELFDSLPYRFPSEDWWLARLIEMLDDAEVRVRDAAMSVMSRRSEWIDAQQLIQAARSMTPAGLLTSARVLIGADTASREQSRELFLLLSGVQNQPGSDDRFQEQVRNLIAALERKTPGITGVPPREPQ